MQSALSETRELFRERQESFVNEMDWLKTMYVFPGGNSVELFLSSHRAVGAVLEDALPHLKESFGPDIVFKLETSTEEDEPPILYVIAVWRGSVEGAVAAVESLDEKWWLDNSSRSPDMAFTYELD